ncbi:MAG: DASH family cryptochrome [Hydrococcus sp. C42_A2020_068]|uniref:DASH family cryptochrome n=1 Tax=Pleurocapsa sp. PCC 7327 TaxID=118163 RepID=UPI00029F9C40|nr:DASH family cryptochrome [Pleurocapsa sp. PCC 7327]AFY78461.1 cryptochrome, DASH family [Pleurocapsa sp. PCC 7327]MBF2022340.1 DASH family cryptochrome [Hydrococcus sp. C42_A2020_068]
MTSKRILIWYRNDLRIHDNKLIYQALKEKAQIIPVYCFDKRQFVQTYFGFPKTGKFRAQFLRESVADLRNSLQKLGSNLIVRLGFPEKIIPALAQELNIDAVYYHEEVTSEELAVEKSLKKALSQIGVKVNSFWGATLYHPDNLPFKIHQIPELFTNFRKQLEKKSTIDPTLPSPQKLPPLPKVEPGEIPQLLELGIEELIFDERAVLKFQGGETKGLVRLHNYFWEKDCLRTYKETRNGMLGLDYSSKFSPWLALGCLSPRLIYEQVQKYESERIKNDSTYWLVFELMWRDFFRFICAKHGNRIFRKSGLQGLDIPWKEDWKRFQLWQEGKTGYPLVDANMRELAATGFMSNRGRQNVASFLTKNLGINWQMGAEWFESLLIDYDVCSNYGNWNYTAGVGNDARGFRYFNVLKQSKDYDSKGDYLRHWLLELASLPGDKIHEPWKLSQEEQKHFRVRIGVDYPRPIVDFFQSIKNNEQIYQAAVYCR